MIRLKGGIILYLDQAKDASKKSFKMMIAYTLISQVLIFIRTKVMMADTDLFFNADEYVVAFVAVTYIAELFASGLLLTIVPLLHKAKSEGGQEERLRFINNLIHITLLVSLVVIIFGYIFADDIIKLNDTGLSQEEFLTSVKLFKIGLPMIIIILLKPVHIAYLQSNHGFKSGPKGGVYYNLIFIAYLLFFSRFGHEGLMIAAVLAYASYYLIIIDSLKRLGFKFRKVLDFKDPRLKQFIYSFLLVMIYQLLKRNIFELDANLVAQSGSIFGFLGNAVYIIDFVVIILISVITTITYPLLSETYYDKKEYEFKVILNKAVDIIIKILVPMSIVLIVFAEPTTQLFFGYGKGLLFKDKLLSTYEIAGTVTALRYLGIGALFLGLNIVFIRALFARGDYRTPVFSMAIGSVLNYGLGILLFKSLGEEGIALSFSITAIIVGLILVYKLNTEKLIDFNGFLKTLGVSSVLGILVSIFVFIIYKVLGQTDIATLASYTIGVLIYIQLNKNAKDFIVH